MASQLTEAHIVAQARLRKVVSDGVGLAWTRLGSYNEADVDPFLGLAVPLVLAGQRQSIALTNGYIARFMGRKPLALDTAALSGAGVRNGTEPRDVYRRPFVTVWSALKAGTAWQDAVAQGFHRATEAAETDVQLTMRATSQAVQELDDGIYGYARTADGGACAYCAEIDGAYVKSADAAPIHPRCGCGLSPLIAPHPRASKLPSGLSVHDHGELGPTIGSADHHFTTEAQTLG